MDKNHNGKLDREEIAALHKSRMADPLSMKQHLESGQTRQPPAGVRPPGLGGGTPPGKPAEGTKPATDAATAAGEPFAVAPNGRNITGKQAFEQLDVNTDGRITAEEFRRSPGMSDEAKAKATVAKVDKNGDGVLSMEEFLTVFNQRHTTPPNTAPATPPAKP